MMPALRVLSAPQLVVILRPHGVEDRPERYCTAEVGRRTIVSADVVRCRLSFSRHVVQRYERRTFFTEENVVS